MNVIQGVFNQTRKFFSVFLGNLQIPQRHNDSLPRPALPVAVGLDQLQFSWRTWKTTSGVELPVVYALMPPRDSLKVTPASIHCLGPKGARLAVLVQRFPFSKKAMGCVISLLMMGNILGQKN